MRKSPVLLLLLLLVGSFSFSQSAHKIHYKATLVDTHNDILSSAMLEGKDISHRLTTGQSDLERWNEGGLDVQFFSIWTDRTPRNKAGFFKDANQEIDSLEIIKNTQEVTLTAEKQLSDGLTTKLEGVKDASADPIATPT